MHDSLFIFLLSLFPLLPHPSAAPSPLLKQGDNACPLLGAAHPKKIASRVPRACTTLNPSVSLMCSRQVLRSSHVNCLSSTRWYFILTVSAEFNPGDILKFNKVWWNAPREGIVCQLQILEAAGKDAVVEG